MKRILRWFFPALVLLSVLLLIRIEFVLWDDDRSILHLAWLDVGSWHLTLDEFQGSLYCTKSAVQGFSLDDYYSGYLIWFRFGTQELSLYWKATAFAIPYWPVPLLIIAVFMIRLAHFSSPFNSAKRRHAATNLCQVCGYDLRATPDRCPECGTIPKKVI
jgi:hypothetical protein